MKPIKKFIFLLLAILIVSFLYVEVSLIVGRDLYYAWLGLVSFLIFLFFSQYRKS